MGVRLALTPGDPRGIGPEVARLGLEHLRAAHPEIAITVYGPDGPVSDDFLETLQAQGLSRARDDVWAGDVGAASIERAMDAALSGQVHGIVTAPVHKPSLHRSGRIFPGQTEMLAERAGVKRVGMLLAAERTRLGPPLRVLLGTTHLPLRAVPDALDPHRLKQLLRTLHNDLANRFGCTNPCITVLGLNPHAGEGGHLGSEDQELITPVCEMLRGEGTDIQGPVPADSAFIPSSRAQTDAYLAMYHDQGLPVLKALGFHGAVNVTLGLPIIRTSVDHGTALDLAATGKADAGSLRAAIQTAIDLTGARR